MFLKYLNTDIKSRAGFCLFLSTVALIETSIGHFCNVTSSPWSNRYGGYNEFYVKFHCML